MDRPTDDAAAKPPSVRPFPLKCRTKKRCFRSPEDAQPYMDSLAAQEHPSLAKRITAYRCRACQFFHIGHNFGPITTRTTRRGKHAPKFL